jgi:photosystem II stability/assembly factor-like uncharacterized protein
LVRIVVSSGFGIDGTLYALTDDQGLWRSTDRGETWQSVMYDNPVDLAIDAANPSGGYAVVTGGALLQVGGRLLLPNGEQASPSWITQIAASPDGTLIVGAPDGRVYQSKDDGVTWLEVSTFSGEAINDIVATGSVIYLATETGILAGYWPGALIPMTPTPIP